MKYFLDTMKMCCPYFFPVTSYSAKTTIRLINSRKGKVLILEWGNLKERLKAKKTQTK